MVDWKDKTACRLDGRVVLVTGASAGLGKETARDLAQRGATVICGCRNLEKAEGVIDSIVAEDPSIPKERFVIMKLDLGDNASVKLFAEEVKAKFPVIDVLINNAGKMAGPREVSKDGFESQLATNHIGHFYLTYLLIDNVLASPNEPRIINVSSRAHENGMINFEDLHWEKSYPRSGFGAYGQSKLANVLFTKSLAQKYAGQVNTYSLHPGVVKTELARNLGWMKYVGKMFSFLMKDEKDGAQTTIYCAVSPDVDQQTGLYYADCALKEPAPQAKDMQVAQKLWDVTCEMLGITW